MKFWRKDKIIACALRMNARCSFPPQPSKGKGNLQDIDAVIYEGDSIFLELKL